MAIDVNANIIEVRDFIANKLGETTYKENIEKLCNIAEEQQTTIEQQQEMIDTLSLQILDIMGV